MVEQLANTNLTTLTFRENLDKITTILKSLANEKRVDILILLDNQSPLDFQAIKEHVQISKTALANHLNILESENLIQRLSRGIYEITLKGTTFLSVNASLVMDIEKNMEYYTQSSKSVYNRRNLNQFNVKSGHICSESHNMTPSNNSMISCITSLFNSQNLEMDENFLQAFSGACFLNHLSVDNYDIAMQHQYILENDILSNIETLGSRFVSYYEALPYPTFANIISFEDFTRTKHIFTMIKKELHKSHLPILVFGMDCLAYSLIVGYENENFIVDCIRENGTIKRKAIRFDAFRQIPFINMIIPRKIEITKKPLDYPAILQRAVKLARGNETSSEEHYTGLQIYDAWKLLVQELSIYDEEFRDEKKQKLMVLGEYYRSMKNHCAIFLANLAKAFPRSSKEFLLKSAAQHYEKITSNFEEIIGSLEQWSSLAENDTENQTVSLIDECKDLEQKALTLMLDASGFW